MINSKRILFVEHSSIIGGSTMSLKAILIDSIREGYECHVICPNERIANFFENLGAVSHHCMVGSMDHNSAGFYRMTPIGILRTLKILLTTLLSFIRLGRILRQVHPDIIYLNSSTLILYTGFFKLYRKKVFIHVREVVVGGHLGFRRHLIKRIADRYADYIIYVSEFEFNVLKTDERKSFVMYSYIHPEEIENDRMKSYDELFGEPKKKFSVIALGGLFSVKGGDKLLEMTKYLDDDVELIIVGSRDPRQHPHDLKIIEGSKYLSQVLTLLKENSVSDKVRFVGKVFNPQDYLRISDALIFWTAVPHFPRVVFEAWFSKRPVLYFNPLYSSRVINSSNVYEIESSSPEALADGVSAVQMIETNREEKMNEAYLTAHRNYSPHNFKVINNLFQEILK